MKKVIAFVGSARKKHTYDAVAQFLNNLKAYTDVETEIVCLSTHALTPCRGCKLCCDRGEELCPLKDDRDILIEKMLNADAVIFATPNYSFHVSAIMKVFLDKLGFAFHRPRMFGKTFTSIVAQGIYGGNKIVSYLDFVGSALGFNTVRGVCITTLDPMTDKQQKQIDHKLERLARRFASRMDKPALPVPSMTQLMFFRYGRTKMRIELDDSYRDFTYYADKGWFTADYYYPTRLGFIKKTAGNLVDRVSVGLSKGR